MATMKQKMEFEQQCNHLNGVKQTYTGVDNGAGGRKPGLSKQKIMLEPGVYQTRTAKLCLSYNGYDESKEVAHAMKVMVTVPEKWLDSDTPVSSLKAFFMKAYRKKHPTAPLSALADEEITLAIKDESMFVFSKKAVPDDAVIHKTFWDRQDVWAFGPQDWREMKGMLTKYRKLIVRSLAHTHRHVRCDPTRDILPVTSGKQLAPNNTCANPNPKPHPNPNPKPKPTPSTQTCCRYVIFTGWYKMQCVIVRPEHTCADLKAGLMTTPTVHDPHTVHLPSAHC